MKPGMQRDLLVAYWLLFDEMGLGDDDPPAPHGQVDATPPVAKEPEKPKARPNGGKSRRRP